MKKIEVTNSNIMGNMNLINIFQLIHKHDSISRKELAERTDYSPGTISNHVKTLIKEGYVVETDKGFSNGGRKPVYLTVNSKKAYMLCVDIEVNKVKIVIFDLKLKVVMKHTILITDKSSSSTIIRKIFTQIDEMMKDQNLNNDEILGIGIAVPGLVDKDKGVLEFAPNLGWRDINIVKIFREQYDLPIYLENEAKVATIGERDIIYPEVNNMVFASINEGIGCGIIFDKKLYKGASGNAGEFGHLIIKEDGYECHCGNKGCWETYASESYILEKIKRLSNKEILDIDEVYKEAKSGNEDFIKILKKTGENIGIGLANIVNSLSPELIVIGGNIIKIKEYISDEVIKVIKAQSLSVAYKKVDIKFSKLGDNATVYGIAKLVFDSHINLLRGGE
ncbi:putative NBD/HSP70 family sugar kinase [Orenia metallireducens]|uniref:Sugar kinase of the NBD/HSP70 family, may contain an N-terminal HTH domain n=1 Tax=Orenia metallireducens TaxID=1413210 RepID=A0A285IFR8_9FIRM|nr:ROK family transcriptional regulator [Orenia metallireducens]PRX18162.1 putative NBD/HSP70 family sugar kinase [Orenia metallireducens]SNY46792.1 Sugar kinase of the NBD/HSP70 family, may contain an N-terminal HTH domain [Orenia metallireducens]